MLGFIGILGFTQTDWVTYRNEFIMDRVQYAQVSMEDENEAENAPEPDEEIDEKLLDDSD